MQSSGEKGKNIKLTHYSDQFFMIGTSLKSKLLYRPNCLGNKGETLRFDWVNQRS